MVKSVCAQADLLATAEKISDEEFISLKLASVFLFTGYINDYDKPLESCFSSAEEILPRYGFDQGITDEVKKLIQNSFRNKQESVKDNILHDARYDYLGRVDYIRLTDKLLREESEYGMSHTRKEWIDIQRKLLLDHEFITSTGRLLRSIQVEDQISALMESTE